MSTEILDLPPEILERIFSYLRLDLLWLTRLAAVCRKFRDTAYRVPINVKIPLTNNELEIFSRHKIPVTFISNMEPSYFVKYQFNQLNLSRLKVAQLISNDYLRKKYELSPHYIELLEHLAYHSIGTKSSLSHLQINVDLIRESTSLRCAKIITQFKNLIHLCLHFSPQIELQQRICGKNYAQSFFDEITSILTKLKTLYVIRCPSQNISLKSSSIEKLGLYKSEFLYLKELSAPNLKTFMFQHGLSKLINHASSPEDEIKNNLLDVLYDGCPNLENFNNFPIRGGIKKLSRKEWNYYVIRLVASSYGSQSGQ